MKYFEYNLPESAPSYLLPELANRFEDMVHTVSARMDKLEAALALSGMDGADFAATAKRLFDSFRVVFEAMTPEQLAAWVKDLYDGTPAEKRLDWPNAVVIVDSAFVTTSEWEMIRHIGIGGSDAAVILGASKYRSQRELYHDKIGTPIKLEMDPGKEAIFGRGHILEDSVVEAFCKATGAKRIPETRMFRSKTHPCVTANIDAVLQFPDGSIFIYEAKTTKEENRKAWTGGKIPPSYVPQTRQYPAVLNDDRICGTYIGCLFVKDYIVSDIYVGASYDDSQFLSHLVERSETSEQYLLDAEQDFYQQHLEAGVEPTSISGDIEKEIEFVRSISGPADPAAPILDFDIKEFLPEAEKYLDLDKKVKEAKETLDSLTAQRKAVSLGFIKDLGQTIEGRIHIDDERYIEVKFSPRTKKEVDYEKLAIAYPAAYTDCVSVNPESSRVFSLKEKKYGKAAKKAAP